MLFRNRMTMFENKEEHPLKRIIFKRSYMNTLSVKGNWNEVSGKLKQKFANLTDDDLLFKEGKEEELVGRLQKKLGKTKEEVRSLIEKI